MGYCSDWWKLGLLLLQMVCKSTNEDLIDGAIGMGISSLNRVCRLPPGVPIDETARLPLMYLVSRGEFQQLMNLSHVPPQLGPLCDLILDMLETDHTKRPTDQQVKDRIDAL